MQELETHRQVKDFVMSVRLDTFIFIFIYFNWNETILITKNGRKSKD